MPETKAKTTEHVISGKHDPLDHDMPDLDNNDVWLYQHVLESFLERNAPGMAGRQKAMLRILCAQARRYNAKGG